jgi:hypothetical protein
MEFTDFGSLVAWVVTFGGAGVISYWLLDKIEQVWPWLLELASEWKRVIAISFAIVIGLLFSLVAGATGISSLPVDMAGWLDLAVIVGVSAATVGQVAHGFMKRDK